MVHTIRHTNIIKCSVHTLVRMNMLYAWFGPQILLVSADRLDAHWLTFHLSTSLSNNKSWFFSRLLNPDSCDYTFQTCYTIVWKYENGNNNMCVIFIFKVSDIFKKNFLHNISLAEECRILIIWSTFNCSNLSWKHYENI